MIKIIRNGVAIQGWKSVSVGLSLSTLCNGFHLSQFVSDNFDSPVLFPGDELRIEVDGELLIEGFVDKMESSFSSGSHDISISGREKTCDLVDCSLKEFGLSWKNKTAEQIIKSVCDCFGLLFRSNGVTTDGTIAKFCPDPGCTGSDIISDVCRQKCVVCTSAGDGIIQLVNDDFDYAEDFIRQGVNVVSASVTFDNSERYSDYVVLCSSDPKTKRRGEVFDGEIARNRCLVVVDESFGTVDSANQKASFEALSRSARSTTLKVSMVGWKRSNGKLWRPGVLVDVLIPAFFGKNVQTLLVNSVELSYDSSGSVVDLELVRKDYYSQPPKKKVKSKGKADPWADIRKKTALYEDKK